MFIVIFARVVKYVSRRDSDVDRDEHFVEYNETIVPWMRRFVWLWVKHWKYTLFCAAVGVPVSHYLASGYGYTIGYFWMIYAPVCGLFFNYRHYDWDGEGPYYLNSGFSAPARMRSRRLFDRF